MNKQNCFNEVFGFGPQRFVFQKSPEKPREPAPAASGSANEIKEEVAPTEAEVREKEEAGKRNAEKFNRLFREMEEWISRGKELEAFQKKMKEQPREEYLKLLGDNYKEMGRSADELHDKKMDLFRKLRDLVDSRLKTHFRDMTKKGLDPKRVDDMGITMETANGNIVLTHTVDYRRSVVQAGTDEEGTELVKGAVVTTVTIRPDLSIRIDIVRNSSLGVSPQNEGYSF